MVKIPDEAQQKLAQRRQELIKELQKVDDAISSGLNIYKKRDKVERMADENTAQPVVKLTVAERKTKATDMINKGVADKDIRSALGVSTTYVYNLKKALGKL